MSQKARKYGAVQAEARWLRMTAQSTEHRAQSTEPPPPECRQKLSFLFFSGRILHLAWRAPLQHRSLITYEATSIQSIRRTTP